MISKLDLWLVGIAGFVAVNGVVGWHFYDKGKQSVALASTRDSLIVVVKHSKAIEQQRDSIGRVLTEQSKMTEQSHTVYVHDKSKVTLKGDTAVTKDSSQVLLPEVAQQLRDADLYIAKLVAENASLWFALRTDSTLIANQAEQIRLNQNIAKMVSGSRFSKGLQVGAGYCLSAQGRSPCAYVGYGFSVKIP